MMIAPALPCPAAVESVLRTAAMPAAPAVTSGNAGRGRDGGGACGGGGGLEETAERAGDELSARECAVRENLLNDERRGNRAEHNPERDHGHADGRLQRVERRGRVNEPETTGRS